LLGEVLTPAPEVTPTRPPPAAAPSMRSKADETSIWQQVSAGIAPLKGKKR